MTASGSRMNPDKARLWNAESGPAEGYEPETVRVFEKVLTAGDNVLVCGAHQGFFVRKCAELVGSTGRVFGFEPEPRNFALLTEKCGGMDNVTLFNCALGDREATAKFFVNADNDGGHALWDVSKNPFNVETQKEHRTIDVQVKTIDGLFEDVPFKLLMLDAEGSEHAILRGGINNMVDNEVPYIVCEINDAALRACGTSQMELREYLAFYGYKVFWLDRDKSVDIGRDEWRVTADGEAVIFNVLFSRKGGL